MEVLANSQRAMASIHEDNRIRTTLQSKLSPHTRFRLEVGDPVRVYREDSHRWDGPFNIERIEKKQICIEEGRVNPFIITSVIPEGIRHQDKKLGHLIENTQALEKVNNYLTEFLKPSDPR